MSRQLPDSMPWRIYQAYLQGPRALFRLFEETFGRQALYGPPDPDQQQRAVDALSDDISRLKAQVGRLQAEVSELRGHNSRLLRRNAELEAVIGKDSHNSSRPPSSDPPWAKRTRSLRRPSGRRPGGQPGHRGHTLWLTQKSLRVIRHRPRQCRHCSNPLGEGWVADTERRQVVERRAEMVRCSSCGHRTKASFLSGVDEKNLHLVNHHVRAWETRLVRSTRAVRGVLKVDKVSGARTALEAPNMRVTRHIKRAPWSQVARAFYCCGQVGIG